jgi:hypothetical protein
MTTDNSDRRLIGEAAFVITDAICRLNISGERIPRRWPTVLDDLNRALSASGQETCQPPSTHAALETTAQQAQRLGVSPRTIQRRAARAGIEPIAGRYVLERPDT